ncbi:DUF3027 domain-containing protein [Nesterenkonia natronophila]|uniref:DUF3027 domain-containing protein n=1 Tax=Nesterenkonia natronophila TaxID=2174932 RepID=A0A3A4F062_9MICC|nr:DUF3027 domain-containing protein [Nesterenkonia natronophila]RJN31552.1 DUF3027 domain-containing protein [Nesterenkonia natronophila]
MASYKKDAALVEAVSVARSALSEVALAAQIGEHLGTRADGERLITHRFAADRPGYRGWEWFVTVARAPRSKKVTVCELGLLPGHDALIAPEWVPWSERLADADKDESS